MLKHTLISLMDAFDNVDDDGNLEFYMGCRFRLGDEYKTLESLARRMIESFFCCQQLAILRLDIVNSHLKEVLLDITGKDEGGWVIKINFCKLMHLPGVAPAKELAELRSLFDLFRRIMAEEGPKRAHFSIQNNKSRNKKVFGKIYYSYINYLDDALLHPALDAQTRVDTFVANSLILQGYLRQVALTLGKIGPHSWINVSEDQLFGPVRDPGPAREMLKELSCEEKMLTL